MESFGEALENCGKITGRFLAQTLLLGVTMSIEGFYFYTFSIQYMQDQFESSDDSDGKTINHSNILLKLSLVLFLQSMSVVSLLALWFGNPGYVKDFFTTIKNENFEGDQNL